MARETHQPGAPNNSTLSGRVFISGVGFLVTAAMWALIGFIRYDEGQNTLAALNVGLLIAHIAIGAMVLRRIRAAWGIGLALAVIGMLATVPNEYYLPLLGDGVTGLLLYFSRRDLMTEDTHVSRAGDR